MKRNRTILSIIVGISCIACSGQKSLRHPADKFLDYLNQYNIDSLVGLVAEDFQLKRSYTTYTNNKKSFLEKYLPNSKNFNGKYLVLNSTKTGNSAHFLVEDQSDYLKLLQIDYPKWQIQIITNKLEKIESMTIDTTENYQVYLKQTMEKTEQFETWLKLNYPNETLNQLINTAGLLIQRVKEYSKKIK